jgi:hypothetical protein
MPAGSEGAVPQMHILGDGGQAVPMVEEPYPAEEVLQRLLEETPDLIPGELIDEADPRRWMLVAREAVIALEGAGKLRLDHLFLDQDGVPTLVEVKRSSDTRLRREVVAQMLDYAANLSVTPGGRIRDLLEARLTAGSAGVDEALAALLGDDHDPSSYWDQVDSNLRAGRIRLIFLADRIGTGLQRIIEFLNAQFARTEVLGVEIRQWRGQGVTALVSSVIGNTAAAAETKGHSTGRITPRGLPAGPRARGAGGPRRGRGVDRLVRGPRGLDQLRGRPRPSRLLPELERTRGRGDLAADRRLPMFVAVPLNGLRRRPPFAQPEMLDELVARLNAVEGIALQAGRERPNFPLQVLADPAGLEGVTDVLAWFVARLEPEGAEP